MIRIIIEIDFSAVIRGGAYVKTKWMMTLLLSIVLLAGCGSEESKKFRDDKNVQLEIYETIISKGKERYDLELVPDMDKIKFNLNSGLPTVNDKQLTVPVKTVGKPEFKFEAIIEIKFDNSGYRDLGEVDIHHRGLSGLGKFLLEHIFLEEYKSELEEVINYDSGVSLSWVNVLSKSSVFIEDKEEEDKIIRALTADYNAGKFANPEEYATLLDKHMLEEDKSIDGDYLPDIYFVFKISATSGKNFEKRFYNIVSYLQENKNLPSGAYRLRADSDNKEENKLSELTKIRKLN